MFLIRKTDVSKSFILSYAAIFSHLRRSEKNLIAKKSEVVSYKKGNLIYRQGEPSDAFYCVISGRVKMSRFQDNRETVLEFLTCGMYFGISSLLTTQTHSANAEVVNDSLILRIKKDDFDFILKKMPKLAIGLSMTLSQQIRTRDYLKGAVRSNIISVYSAVSGIGCTMYAINLAISLKRETGKKVIFVEISHSDKEMFKILNIEKANDPLNLKYSILQKDVINKFIIKNPGLDIDFLDIVHSPQTGETTQISSVLSLLTNDYQYVIVDLPLERSEVVFKALTQSDAVHVITDYDEQNLKSTRELMSDLFKNVEYPQEKIKVILNERKDSKKIAHDEIVRILDHDVFANIPVWWDAADKINESSIKVVLTQPDSEYARAIRRIARQIGGVLVGLALGSGAALGLAHIGVIKVLERENIHIDLVAGVSIGALIAALWASGKSGKEIEEIMMEYNKDKTKVFKLLFDFCFSKASIAEGKRVTKFLKRHMGDKTFYDIKLPLKVVACNLDRREKVILDSGDLVDAVRSSVAIPGIFKPVRSGDNLIIDGGIMEPVPVETLAESGIKKIIAVNVLPAPQDIQEGYKNYKYCLEKEKLDMQKRNFIFKIFYRIRLWFRRIIFHSIFDIMVNSILAMEYAMAKESCRKADVVINPIVPGTDWFEFFKTEALIKKGELEAEKALPQIRNLISQ
ncbi:MAG: patatin-like phospholipase family protein [Candidatus Omnitrophica bacterium]|nr:patatin-like phospholipase family protein [Candidatus Omnitrophota bacterium]MDD5351702.1 patatin-like phospholipase family protein [Candidatus Omnitrophota bacterium]MDD5550912.1 patatin-like phospholipase family protein [Candidatus Omnitrophota bacterium]